MTRKRGALRTESGMTLVEVLMSVILLFLLLTGVLFMFEYGLSNAKKIQSRSILSVDATNAMEKMKRQIRCARSFVVPTTNSPIDFIGDVRGDGTDREIIFYRDANTNTLNVSERIGAGTWTTTVMGQGVTAFSITYYDINGAELTVSSSNRNEIKRIGISFTMQRGSSDQLVTTTRTGTVTLRCELTMLRDDWRAVL
jgi:type II secretory pathway pseudopilin PulG